MAKKKKTAPAPRAGAGNASQGAKTTLKDLLGGDILGKLKAQADALKEEEAERKAAEAQAKEEARKAEQKRLDNDFAHLLENSSADWRKFK